MKLLCYLCGWIRKLLKAIQLFKYTTDIHVCSCFYWICVARVCVCVVLFSFCSIPFNISVSLCLYHIQKVLLLWFHSLSSLWKVGLTLASFAKFVPTPFSSWIMVMVVETDKKNALKFFVVSQHMTIDDPRPFFLSSFFIILFIVCSRSWKWSHSVHNDDVLFTVDLTIMFVYWHPLLIDEVNLLFLNIFFVIFFRSL